MPSLAAAVLFWSVAASLLVLWLFGAHHIMLFLLTHLRRKAELPHQLPDPPPKVALLYLTFNDFLHQAALGCVEQRYPDFHVFLLDDSTDAEMRKVVDAFHEEFSQQTTVVRRPDREAFVAGNLNHGVNTAVGDYDLVAVCDADLQLPPDFLARTASIFAADDHIAFVQANHRSASRVADRFAKDFELSIDYSWYTPQIPRQNHGLLMCMGHAVVIRKDVWLQAGGLPTIVQWDTAFTMRLREMGYYGVFAEDVVCDEDYPAGFDRYHRRYFRLVQADSEVLSVEMPRFLRAPGVSLAEKFDLLLRTTRIPLGSLALPFIAAAAMLPWVATEGAPSAAAVDGTLGTLAGGEALLFTLAAAMSPFLVFVAGLRRHPLRLLRLFLGAFLLHLSLPVAGATSLFVFLATGKATFVVTGSGQAVVTGRRSRLISRLLSLGTSHPLVVAVNIGAGLLLGLAAVASGNLVVLGIGLSLLLAPALSRWGWRSGLLAPLVYLPALLIVAGLVAGALGLTGPQAQYLALGVLSILLIF